MTRWTIGVLALTWLAFGSPSAAQRPERALVEAMTRVYRLHDYTAFDWISGRYLKGTLTLEGFARTSGLRAEAERAARKAPGIDEVVNRIEVLPASQGDDEVRVRAYAAIYGSSALERYAPGGRLSGFTIGELEQTARFGLDGTDVGRGPHAIHVIVSSARILLLGEVRASGDRQIAEAAIRNLPGILGVSNRLRVATQK